MSILAVDKRPLWRLAGAVLWLALLAVALEAVTARTWALGHRDAAFLTPPPLSRLPTRLLDVVTLGHRGLYDDVLTIWTLQYLVDPRLAGQDPEAVARTIRLATRHHPRLETLYMISCFVLGFDLKRPDLCEAIVQDGLTALPDTWRIPLTGAFMAARRRDLALAAAHYRLASTRPGAPEYLGLVAGHIEANQGLSPAEYDETVKRLLEAVGTADAGMDEHLRSVLRDLTAPAGRDKGP